MSEVFSEFASTVLKQKYCLTPDETWPEIAERVATNVLKSVGAKKSHIQAVKELIETRRFIPGGRYLYASGRPYHQVNNCLLLKAGDSREGWSELLHNGAMGLMSGAGIGVDYSDVRGEGRPIRKTGGTATGPLALMQMFNECGRGIQQGGSRRSAIWAGLKWSHPDIQKFVTMKNWIEPVRKLKAENFNFPATMDGTNISVQLDDAFFEAYSDDKNPRQAMAQQVYWATVERMLRTGEPGFSIDVGKNHKETLRNAPLCADTLILTNQGYRPIHQISYKLYTVWTGKRWVNNVVFTRTGINVPVVKVRLTGGREIRCEPSHPFIVEIYKGAGKKKRKISSRVKVPAKMLKKGQIVQFSPPEPNGLNHFNYNGYALGYLYGDGSFTSRGSAEATFCTEESKICARFVAKADGISSINEKDGRGYIRIYFKTDKTWFGNRDKDIFPSELFANNFGFQTSFIAGLFDADGNHDSSQNRLRLGSVSRDFLKGVSRLLEQIGIMSHVSKNGSASYSDNQQWQLVVASEYNQLFSKIIPTLRVGKVDKDYEPYRHSYIKVESVEPDGNDDVYCADVRVAEHSFMAEGVLVSNCTELTSSDTDDVCNLGSINMARIDSLEEMREAVELATSFLLAGTVYSDVSYPKVDAVRTKNRRLGLGLMGIHEWLLTHGKKYGSSDDLAEYLKVYATSGKYARQYADEWELSHPVKTRAIAPNGTISIIGETSSGCEPIFCVAYKRRYLKGLTWNYQYVLDPTAKRLIEKGIDPDTIEDAYTLADDVERRVAFQAWLQGFVDHAISSTINLPVWGSEANNSDGVRKFGNMLLKYLPLLRGITCYPDGSRSGQPLTTVSYKVAAKHLGEVFVESGDSCQIGKGESCGD